MRSWREAYEDPAVFAELQALVTAYRAPDQPLDWGALLGARDDGPGGYGIDIPWDDAVTFDLALLGLCGEIDRADAIGGPGGRGNYFDLLPIALTRPYLPAFRWPVCGAERVLERWHAGHSEAFRFHAEWLTELIGTSPSVVPLDLSAAELDAYFRVCIVGVAREAIARKLPARVHY